MLARPSALNRLLVASCVGQFLAILNISVVYVALPGIQHGLHMSSDDVQWIVNAYALIFAGLLLLGGRLADVIGPRKMFVFGTGLFVIASSVATLATSSAILFTARGAEGIAGAALSPASMALLTTEFPEGRPRQRALGAWSAWAGSGGAAGPLVGGLLVTLGGWRTVLAVSCPLGLAALTLALAAFRASQAPSNGHMMHDAGGGLLGTGCIFLMVFGLSQVGNSHWNDPLVVGALAGSAFCAAALYLQERRQSDRALVPLDVFRSKALTGANIIMLVIGVTVFASWYILALFLEEGLGLKPLIVGAALLPLPLTVIGAAQLSTWLMPRIGGRWTVMGAVIPIATGLAILGQSSSGRLEAVLPSATLMAFGAGASFPPLNWSATVEVDPTRAGLASGLINTARQLGGSLGIAVLATVATINTPRQVEGSAGIASGSLLIGYAAAFRCAAIVSAFALPLCLLLPTRTSRPTASEGVTLSATGS